MESSEKQETARWKLAESKAAVGSRGAPRTPGRAPARWAQAGCRPAALR